MTDKQQKLSAYIFEHFACIPREDEIKELEHLVMDNFQYICRKCGLRQESQEKQEPQF